MRMLLCAALLLLLCSSQVQSLKCYTCENDPKCKTETECPPSSQFCRTEATATAFSRSCEEICVPSVTVTCCTEDLCPL
ncbi:lymphocyte antigen 6D [Lepisosteus oculatus]|uniref:lymphocyte antigen 6D n=1 Tax=Lepisosteus oculatus TaxID=7918 RepID=UPI0037219843